MENWVEIDDYPNYLVSDHGRVFGKRTNTLLKVRLDAYGYPMVAIRNENGPKTAKTHRLVIEAFLESIPMGFEVNHIDGDKTNNHLSNLEVITHSENLRHAYRTGLHSQQRRVQCVDTGEIFHSMAEASRITGKSIAYISLDARGLRTSQKGLRFVLLNDGS